MANYVLCSNSLFHNTLDRYTGNRKHLTAAVCIAGDGRAHKSSCPIPLNSFHNASEKPYDRP